MMFLLNRAHAGVAKILYGEVKSPPIEGTPANLVVKNTIQKLRHLAIAYFAITALDPSFTIHCPF